MRVALWLTVGLSLSDNEMAMVAQQYLLRIVLPRRTTPVLAVYLNAEDN
jgi:hypothetical protein